jgi:RNA polymerase sigma factor (sigma-70 family)
MIEENMWVVDHVIKNYRHLMQYNDLKSAGLYGLIQGIEKYKEGKGAKPSTYARHWVKAEVLKSLYENRNVHIPWNKINDYIKEKNEDDMSSSLSGGRTTSPSYRQLSKSHKKRMVPQFEVSLDTLPTSDDYSNGRSDHIELQSSLSSTDLHIKEKNELKEHIDFVIEQSDLSEIEKTTISYRFGLEGLEPKTLHEISTLTGYTAMGIQKAEKRALSKLKKDSLLQDLFL